MMDIKFIRENAELMKKVAKNKNSKVDIDNLLAVDDKRRSLISEVEKLKSELNKRSKTKPGPEEIAALKELSGKIKEMDAELTAVENGYRDLMLLVPNVYADDTPVGADDTANREVARHGKPPKFSFTPKDHITLGKELDLIDLEAGAKTSGYRGYYLKNEAVLLHFALLWLAINKMKKHGFELMTTPTLLRDFALLGSGHFPEGKDEIYQIGNPGRLVDGSTKEETFLAGTSEPALLAYFSDKVLEEKDLPQKMFAYSSCFRSEVGSWGRDVRGIKREHQFDKLEMFSITTPEKSDEEHKYLLSLQEKFMGGLNLPYRVVQLCAGDLAGPSVCTYDIEAWIPSQGKYRETHSTSNTTDFQSRRLNIKYKKEDGSTALTHTLNGTAIVTSRFPLALIENHQQKDGSIKIPRALRKYFEKRSIKKA